VLPETVGVIQVTSLDTDAVQPVPAVTLTLKLPLPPPAGTLAELDDSEYEQVTDPVIVKDVRLICEPLL